MSIRALDIAGAAVQLRIERGLAAIRRPVVAIAEA
jgi:hypothetical protein